MSLLKIVTKITIKGLESRRGDWSKLAKNAQLEVLKAVLNDGNGEGALKIVQNIISNIRDRKITLDEFTQAREIMERWLGLSGSTQQWFRKSVSQVLRKVKLKRLGLMVCKLHR